MLHTSGQDVLIPHPAVSPVRVSLLVDSRDRELGGTPGAYTVRLPEAFRNVSGARLVTAELPTSFFVFTAARGNTSLLVTVGADTRVVTIPDGNYSFSRMTAAVTTALNAAFPAAAFAVTISPASFRATIAAGVTFSLNTASALAYDATAWGLAWYLGFPKNATLTGTSVTAPNVASVNPETYLLLDVEGMNFVREVGPGGGGTPNRTFAKVPVNAESFEYVYFDSCITANAIDPPLPRVDSLRLRWRFHDGRAVDFQMAEHSLTLELTCTVER